MDKMVNTFITSFDLDECARALDYRRLGKQRVEAFQIYKVLKFGGKGWRNHPAVLAWEGHLCALAMYTNAMIREWVRRGYKNTMQFLPHCSHPKFPWWWGWEPIMMSHKASLNRKMPQFYSFEVGEYAKFGYIWPSKVPQQYRTDDPPLSIIASSLS
jgi:hypothetical protein